MEGRENLGEGSDLICHGLSDDLEIAGDPTAALTLELR
jgi:hypothetical protein